MAHEADDEKVRFQLFDQPDDPFGDVAGDEMGLDSRPGPLRLGLGRVDDGSEAMVRVVFSSAISSILAGKCGSSSTVTI